MLSITMTVFPGRIKEGVVLSMNQDVMRIALRGSGDTAELRRLHGQWLGEDGHPVDFEVLLTDGQVDDSLFAEPEARVMAAGRN